MKISLVFLLVALCTCYGHVRQSSGYETHPSHSRLPKTNCLHEVLTADLKNVLSTLRALFCSYKDCQDKKGTKNECSLEEWTRLLAEVRVTLGDTGCAVDQLLLGGNPTVEKIAEEIGKALEQIRDPVRDILIQLGVEQPLFDLLCSLLGDVLLNLSDLLGKLGDSVGGIVAPVTNVVGDGLLGGLLGGKGGKGLLGGVLGR